MPLKFLNDETKKKRKGMSKWENRGGGGGASGCARETGYTMNKLNAGASIKYLKLK